MSDVTTIVLVVLVIIVVVVGDGYVRRRIGR